MLHLKAVGQLTMAFANEWAGKGVNINAIARLYCNRQYRSLRNGLIERSLARIPAGRWGEAKDFAGPMYSYVQKLAYVLEALH